MAAIALFPLIGVHTGRGGDARLNRLTYCFSKKLENLEAAVALHMAYYNFCWRPGKMRISPAMAAGVTPSLWRFDDLMAENSLAY